MSGELSGCISYRNLHCSTVNGISCESELSIKSKEERKFQESIQLVSHLTQNTLWESDKRTRKRHLQKRLESQLRLRAVTVYFKVIRRRKPSSAEGTKGWRALQGYHSPLSLAPPPREFVLIFSTSMFVFNWF